LTGAEIRGIGTRKTGENFITISLSLLLERGPIYSRRIEPLAKPELGTKRTCPECAARFYDLGKMPCECPKCEHAFEPEILLKSKKRIEEEVKPKEASKKEAEKEEAEEETGVEEVTAEGMSKMPEAVDEDGVAISSDDEEDEVEEINIEDVALDDDEEEDDDGADSATLMNFDDDQEDVAAIIDTDIDKLKDET
jgi:uncharacterized protein (TIGR02300 family)